MTPDEMQEQLWKRLDAIEETMQTMTTILDTIAGILEERTGTPTARRDDAPKIATYAELYGPVMPAPVQTWAQPRPLHRQRGWFRRWLTKDSPDGTAR